MNYEKYNSAIALAYMNYEKGFENVSIIWCKFSENVSFGWYDFMVSSSFLKMLVLLNIKIFQE